MCKEFRDSMIKDSSDLKQHTPFIPEHQLTILQHQMTMLHHQVTALIVLHVQ